MMELNPHPVRPRKKESTVPTGNVMKTIFAYDYQTSFYLITFLVIISVTPQTLADPPALIRSAANVQWTPKLCELDPLPDHQVSFRIGGVEQCRWHFGNQYPRPFFYPLNGPTGQPLTRMGHPGAENHDHHRSVWFASHDIDGHDFWSENGGTQIRQKHWYRYRDGDDEAIMASKLGWYDAAGRERMEQDLAVAIIPLADNQYALELQIDLRPGAGLESVELGKTNFGILAVRVAKSISAHFGSGRLTNSNGDQGEPAIFGKRAKWVDYSGPVAVGTGDDRQVTIQGITYMDHPQNPSYPSHWHVRDDGWMCASCCFENALGVTRESDLRLRYLLLVHDGAYNENLAGQVHQAFIDRPGLTIRKATKTEPHRQYEVERTQ
jgi:hypothetical protein